MEPEANSKTKLVVTQNVVDERYVEFNISGASGGFKPDGSFQMTLIDDYPDPFQNDGDTIKVVHKAKARVIMSPAVLKSLAEWLFNHSKNVNEVVNKTASQVVDASDGSKVAYR